MFVGRDQEVGSLMIALYGFCPGKCLLLTIVLYANKWKEK